MNLLKGTKVLGSFWSEDTKTAILTRNTKYGKIAATATADEEDFEYATSWDGFRICERKISAKILRYYIQEKKLRLKGMKQMANILLMNAFSDTGDDELYFDLSSVCFKQIRAEKKQIEDLENMYNYLTDKKEFLAWCQSLVEKRKEIQEMKPSQNEE